MKRRCPNHWTKGTKKQFFIYLRKENRSGSFSFYTKFDDFVCVHVGDFRCEWGRSSPLPTGSPVTHQPRPFLFSDHKAPWSLSLSFIPPSRSVLSNSNKKERGAVRRLWFDRLATYKGHSLLAGLLFLLWFLCLWKLLWLQPHKLFFHQHLHLRDDYCYYFSLPFFFLLRGDL